MIGKTTIVSAAAIAAVSVPAGALAAACDPIPGMLKLGDTLTADECTLAKTFTNYGTFTQAAILAGMGLPVANLIQPCPTPSGIGGCANNSTIYGSVQGTDMNNKVASGPALLETIKSLCADNMKANENIIAAHLNADNIAASGGANSLNGAYSPLYLAWRERCKELTVSEAGLSTLPYGQISLSCKPFAGVDLGNMPTPCCEAASVRIARDWFADSTKTAQQALVTKCPSSDTDACQAGTNNPTDTVYAAALKHMCGGHTGMSGACGASVAAGLSAADANVATENAALIAKYDSTANSKFDECEFCAPVLGLANLGFGMTQTECDAATVILIGGAFREKVTVEAVLGTDLYTVLPPCPVPSAIGGCQQNATALGPYDNKLPSDTAYAWALSQNCQDNLAATKKVLGALMDPANMGFLGTMNAAFVPGYQGFYATCTDKVNAASSGAILGKLPWQCKPLGAVDMGSQTTSCCEASTTALASAAFAAKDSTLSGLVTSCPANSAIGGCETTGTNAGKQPTAAALKAAVSEICATATTTCGSSLLAGLEAAKASNANNAALAALQDANTDGVFDACVKCAAGKARLSPLAACSACSDGSVPNADGHGCSPCAANTFSPNSTVACTACEAGFEATGTGNTACTKKTVASTSSSDSNGTSGSDVAAAAGEEDGAGAMQRFGAAATVLAALALF